MLITSIQYRSIRYIDMYRIYQCIDPTLVGICGQLQKIVDKNLFHLGCLQLFYVYYLFHHQQQEFKSETKCFEKVGLAYFFLLVHGLSNLCIDSYNQLLSITTCVFINH